MIVGIDNISPGLSTTQSTLGGMKSFLADLIEGLPRSSPDLQFVVFSPAWADPLPVEDAPNCRTVKCEVPRSRLGRVWFEQTVLPGLIREMNIGLWLGTCNTRCLSRRGAGDRP